MLRPEDVEEVVLELVHDLEAAVGELTGGGSDVDVAGGDGVELAPGGILSLVGQDVPVAALELPLEDVGDVGRLRSEDGLG